MKATIFTCEHCNEQSSKRPEQGFPYAKGWKYLYGLNLKLSDTAIIKLHDKHFCKLECMKLWIDNVMNELIKKDTPKRKKKKEVEK